MKNLTKTSRFISLILRHKPEIIGIKLDNHGWADVNDLLKGVNIDMNTLEEIVNTDEKKRYSFNEDKTKIRANQGHSIKVDVGLKEKEPPNFLYHGTAEKYVNSINKYGLIPKSRLYVHLSEDIKTAIEVGKRHGNPVVYKINSKNMYNNGYKFYLSENNVWLIEKVPVNFIERIDNND